MEILNEEEQKDMEGIGLGKLHRAAGRILEYSDAWQRTSSANRVLYLAFKALAVQLVRKQDEKYLYREKIV